MGKCPPKKGNPPRRLREQGSDDLYRARLLVAHFLLITRPAYCFPRCTMRRAKFSHRRFSDSDRPHGIDRETSPAPALATRPALRGVQDRFRDSLAAGPSILQSDGGRVAQETSGSARRFDIRAAAKVAMLAISATGLGNRHRHKQARAGNPEAPIDLHEDGACPPASGIPP